MESITLSHRPKNGELSKTLERETISKPEPCENEVLVRVCFATISIDDIHISEGTQLAGIPMGSNPSPNNPVVPGIPGIELSGIVEKIGANVSNFEVGDSVFGNTGFPIARIGAWSEFSCVKESFLIKKPDYLTLSEAAAFGGSGLVACSAVIQGCDLQPHHKVLIIGAAGGVGTLAVQMANQKGAYVIAVCSAKNKAHVLSLGADEVIDYTSASFADILGKDKVDFAIDLVGGKAIEKDSIKVLKQTGQFRTIVGPIQYIGDKHIGWFGITKMLGYIAWKILLSSLKGPKYKFISGTQLTFPIFKKLLEEESIKPVVDRIVDFNVRDISSAIEDVRTHRTRGKTVIEINPESE